MTITNEVNTSGARRVGYIQVKTFTDLGMRVVQNGWLNISSPEPMYSTTPEDNMDNLPANKVYFLLNAQAKTDTAIVFTVYQDNATLSSSETWAVPETTTFSAGRHNVRISLEPNPTTSSRTATLTLTSAGVNTPISIIQSAKE
ncbi:kinase suppressor of Ras 2-like [Prevotella sp. MGM2]|nr:kinase suppressor of Ras 2-like [Prevotella sp. MGM2]